MKESGWATRHTCQGNQHRGAGQAASRGRGGRGWGRSLGASRRPLPWRKGGSPRGRACRRWWHGSRRGTAAGRQYRSFKLLVKAARATPCRLQSPRHRRTMQPPPKQPSSRPPPQPPLSADPQDAMLCVPLHQGPAHAPHLRGGVVAPDDYVLDLAHVHPAALAELQGRQAGWQDGAGWGRGSSRIGQGQ